MSLEKYEVREISYSVAMETVIAKHYLHRKCPCSRAYGLFERTSNTLVGVVTYGVPCSSTLLRGICGEEEMHNVYELNRLWVDDTNSVICSVAYSRGDLHVAFQKAFAYSYY